MELEAIEGIFKALYADVAGYDISHQERERVATRDLSFIYGEVLPPAFSALLQAAAPRPGEVFCDLGSGTGKAIFLAALMADFERLVGVELLTGLGDAARSILARYDAEVRPKLPPQKQRQRLEFQDGDLLKADLSRVDVAFAHATCFQADLLEKMTVKLQELRPGARFLQVGMPIEAKWLRPIHFMMCDMNFGQTPASAYIRV